MKNSLGTNPSIYNNLVYDYGKSSNQEKLLINTLGQLIIHLEKHTIRALTHTHIKINPINKLNVKKNFNYAELWKKYSTHNF